MTTATTPSVPAGWYPDPAGGHRSRWWDGAQWTEHVHEPYSAAPVAALKAPEATAWNTVWIWLVILLPLLNLIPVLSVDWRSFVYAAVYSRSGADTLMLLSSPGYLLSAMAGWGVYGLCVLFAVIDWRQLRGFGVPRPFHFAWAFLSAPVYAIGRSVVVHRRTGHGIAPVWVTIGTIVVSVAAAMYVMVVVVSAALLVVTHYAN